MLLLCYKCVIDCLTICIRNVYWDSYQHPKVYSVKLALCCVRVSLVVSVTPPPVSSSHPNWFILLKPDATDSLWLSPFRTGPAGQRHPGVLSSRRPESPEGKLPAGTEPGAALDLKRLVLEGWGVGGEGAAVAAIWSPCCFHSTSVTLAALSLQPAVSRAFWRMESSLPAAVMISLAPFCRFPYYVSKRHFP